MKPLERACRAAHAEHNGTRAARAEAADLEWDGWKSWLPVVTAALIVMRDPSDAMIEASWTKGREELWFDTDESAAHYVSEEWKRMLGALMLDR